MDGFGILLAGFDTRSVVAAVVVGVAFAGPLSGICLFGTESSHWGPCCLFLCCVPFSENDFCFDDDTLPAVGIVATAEVVVAAVAIVVAMPLVLSAIDLRGAKVAHLHCSYNTVPAVAVVCALEVVIASALRLLLGLVVSRIPSVLAAHLLQPVVPNFVLLPPRCPLFLALLPLSIPPAHAGGLLNCSQGPVALPFLYFISVGVLLRRILFAGFGTSCGLAVSSPILYNPMGIIMTFVDLYTLSPYPPCQLLDVAGAHYHVVAGISVP